MNFKKMALQMYILNKEIAIETNEILRRKHIDTRVRLAEQLKSLPPHKFDLYFDCLHDIIELEEDLLS